MVENFNTKYVNVSLDFIKFIIFAAKVVNMTFFYKSNCGLLKIVNVGLLWFSK